MKRHRIAVLGLVLALGILGGCASDRVTGPAESRGGVMTDGYSHKTLYTFDKDAATPPQSTCNA